MYNSQKQGICNRIFRFQKIVSPFDDFWRKKNHWYKAQGAPYGEISFAPINVLNKITLTCIRPHIQLPGPAFRKSNLCI